MKFQERPPAPIEWKHVEVRKDIPILKLVPKASKKTLLIAIPTQKYIEAECFKSIYDLIIPEHITPTFQYFYGYNVEQVRNLIASWGMRGDYTLCVDYDIVLPNDALIKMLAHDKDIVSGVYVQRNTKQLVELFQKDSPKTRVPVSDLTPPKLLEVASCGFGCVLIKGNVLRTMEYPHFAYKSAVDPKDHNKDTMSEDSFFCYKAKSYGFKVWADTSIICPHIGSQTFVPIL
jgi:hypothetical protein